MSNEFVVLPLPVLNGPGAAMDTSEMGTPRTIIVEGDFDNATITIEASVDGGASWGPVALARSGTTNVTVAFCANFMRTNVSGRNGIVPFSAVVGVGGPSVTGQYASIPLPAGVGPGASIAIDTFGVFATLISGGDFPGASIVVEISDDNANWVPLLTFAGQGGLNTATTTAKFIRANVSGHPINGTLAIGAVTTQGEFGGVNLAADGVPVSGGPFNLLNYVGAFGAGVQVSDEGDGEGEIVIPMGIPTPDYTVNSVTPRSLLLIYAAFTGSDTTGDGSIGNPYRTMQRAVRDVPLVTPNGVTFYVICSGIQLEILPPNYTLPQWKSAGSFKNTVSAGLPAGMARFLRSEESVNIFAQPQLVAGSGATNPWTPAELNIKTTDLTVAAGVADPVTGMRTYTLAVARPNWGTNLLKGKFVITVAGGSQNCVITQNTTNTFEINSVTAGTTLFAGAGADVMEPSAVLSGSNTQVFNGSFNIGAIDSLSLQGLKILNTNTGAAGLWSVGWGSLILTSCDLISPTIQTVGPTTYMTRIQGSWIRAGAVLGGVYVANNVFFDKCVQFQGQRSNLTLVPCQPQLRFCIFDGCGTLEIADFAAGIGGNNATTLGATPLVRIDQTAIRNTVSPPNAVTSSGSSGTGSTGDGIHFHGGKAFLQQVDISGSARDGIRCDKGAGFSDLIDVRTAAAANGAGQTGVVSLTSSGANAGFVFGGGNVTLTPTLPGIFTADMVGKNITIAGAFSGGNNGTFRIATFTPEVAAIGAVPTVPAKVTFPNGAGVTEGGLRAVGSATGFTFDPITGLVIITAGSGTAFGVGMLGQPFEIVGMPVASGAGDSLAKSTDSDVMTLTDAAGLFAPGMIGFSVTLAGSTTPANNGTFTIQTFVSATQITFTNAAGVTEAFPGTWTTNFAGNNGIYMPTRLISTTQLEYDNANGVTQASPTVGAGVTSFTQAAGVITLVSPTALFTAAMVGTAITIAGSTTPANNGTFLIASFISPTSITYLNAAGVTEAGAVGTTWVESAGWAATFTTSWHVDSGGFGVRMLDGLIAKVDSTTSAAASGANKPLSGLGATGTGDSFAFAAGIVTLTDAAALFTPAMVGSTITIAGSTTPANNGTFLIANFTSSTVISYANPLGVAEAYPGTWTIKSDMKVGDLPTRTWTSFLAGGPGQPALTEYDVTSAPTGSVNAAAGGFTLAGAIITLTSPTPVAVPAGSTSVGPAFTASMVGRPIFITGATTAANNGTFIVASFISPTSITYTNAAGATEAGATGTQWTVLLNNDAGSNSRLYQ